jgi:xanthine dehydrogenase YagS FAD-binding subunit
MLAFSYAAASDTASALTLAGAGSGGAFIAGGTDLLQLLQEAVIAPRCLIDINMLPLSDVRVEHGSARTGALTRLSDVAADGGIRQHFPLLTQALSETASPQVRNLATVGGNLLQRTRCLYFRNQTLATGAGHEAVQGRNRRGAPVILQTKAQHRAPATRSSCRCCSEPLSVPC